MIAERMSYGGAGDCQPPGRNILVVEGRRHVKRRVERWLSGLVVVVSGE